MVREGRVFKSQQGSGRPEYGAGFLVTAYEVGAEVAIGSIGTTIDVREGHGFAVGDKFIVGLDANRYRPVIAVSGTTIETDSNVPVAAGELLVNLGQDSGTTGPEYTGSGSIIYADMDYSNILSNSTVMTNDVGRYIYHHRQTDRWELVRTPAGVPFAVYQENAVAANTDIYANAVASGGDGSQGDPWTGWINALVPNVTVRFPNGYYLTSSDVTIPEGCALIGNGFSSRIVFDRSGANDIGFVNATNAGNITIRSLYIDGDGNAAASANATFQFTTGTGQNYIFDNVHIVDAAHSGIRIVGGSGVATNCRVHDCSVIGAKRHGIEFSFNVSHSSIEGCYCEDTNTATVGAAIYAGSDATARNITVTGNVVKDVNDSGIRSVATDYSVSGNTVIDCANDGIRLFGVRQTCSGNTVRGSGGQGIKAEAEVTGPGESITITGNTCTGCTESGIQVRDSGGQPSHVTVSGNTCSDNTLHGIHLRGGQDITVGDNHCNDNAGANIWAEAADSTILTRVLISGNHCYKTTTGLGNILVSHTGPVNGVVGSVDIIGNTCDGGGLASYGIGVKDIDPGTSVINIIDNISRNHAADANLSLVVGCYLRHSGIGTGAFATSTPVKGSLWMQTDGAGTRDAVQVYDGAAWRNALITPTIGAASTDVVTNMGRMVFRTIAADPTSSATLGTIGEVVYSSTTQKFYGKHTTTASDTNWRLLGT